MKAGRPHTFCAMGTGVSVWIDHADAATRERLYAMAETELLAFERRFTRFDATSELSRVNADAPAETPVSRAFAAWLSAALWAARWTGGYVDPTLERAMAGAGYDSSMVDGAREQATLREALAVPRTVVPARPDPRQRWRGIFLDFERGVVRLPPGVTLDAGGTGKGYAADLVAETLATRLADGTRWWVDCGGDVRLSELPLGAAAHDVDVEHPFDGQLLHRLRVWGGAVATSTIGRRLWRNAEGGFSHHLLDPATGRPAWTGLVSVTAVASSTLRAETLAKWALLSGPQLARRLLVRDGGLLVRDSGEVEVVEAAGPRARELAA